MTKQDAINRVKRVIDTAGDPEVSHGIEDEMLKDFVSSVLDENYKSIEEAKEVAAEIAKVFDLKLERWYA